MIKFILSIILIACLVGTPYAVTLCPTTSTNPDCTGVTTTTTAPAVTGITPGYGILMDVTSTTGKVFLASQKYGLTIKTATTLASTINYHTAINDSFVAKKIAMYGNYVAVTGKDIPTGYTYLKIFDISNPAAPTVTGTLTSSLVDDTFTGFKDVAMYGNMVVLACGSTGIWVVDITTKTAPTFKYSLATGGQAYGVAFNADGTKVFIANGSGGFKVYSVSLSVAPAQIGTLTWSGHIFRDVEVNNTTGIAALANQQGTLDIINIATPTAPKINGTASLLGGCSHVAVSGSFAAVISYPSGADRLQVFNISNPASPVQVTGSPVSLPGLVNSAQGLCIFSNCIYVANTDQSNGGLLVYNLDSLCTFAYSPIAVPGTSYDIAKNAAGTYAYAAAYPSSVNIIDRSGE